jgi:hypothetical protein
MIVGRSPRRHERNVRVLWGMILLALAYNSLLRYLPTLTGSGLLYVCSHPAANAIKMLFFERDALRHMPEWSVIRWLALNLLVLLAGWTVIFAGLRRLVDQAAPG